MKSQRFCVFTLMLLMGVSATAQQPDSPQKPAPMRISSGVAAGLLKHRVEPQYPQVAKEAKIKGYVSLMIVIDKEGNVASMQPVSGNPVLSVASVDAVKQWKYTPYLLNGNPIEVRTIVTVRF